MSQTKQSHVIYGKHQTASGGLTSYISGFVLSMGLTVATYLFVTHTSGNNKNTVIATILGLALAQFVVQVIFFLHLGRESRPRWNTTALLCMIVVVFILVAGSIWIMNNLNYRMLPPEELKVQMHQNEGL